MINLFQITCVTNVRSFGIIVCSLLTCVSFIISPCSLLIKLLDCQLGMRYTSKLDEFESFVEKTRKYGLVSSSLTQVSPSSVILLIDDLPVVNGKNACERLKKCLQLLLQSVRLPTTILINDYSRSESVGNYSHYCEELKLFLQNAGVFKVVSLSLP